MHKTSSHGKWAIKGGVLTKDAWDYTNADPATYKRHPLCIWCFLLLSEDHVDAKMGHFMSIEWATNLPLFPDIQCYVVLMFALLLLTTFKFSCTWGISLCSSLKWSWVSCFIVVKHFYHSIFKGKFAMVEWIYVWLKSERKEVNSVQKTWRTRWKPT